MNRPRNAPITQIVGFWMESPAEIPYLSDANWATPFCFHCGWTPPRFASHQAATWSNAGGWLEKAHLQDFCSGGTSDPSNIVPLCFACHRIMPEFPDSRSDAVRWVRSEHGDTCPDWWQSRTNKLWGNCGPLRVDRLTFINEYLTESRRQDLFRRVWDLADDGCAEKAVALLRRLGADQQGAEAMLRFRGVAA